MWRAIGAVRREARALGVLALQRRPCAVDRAQLLPDRLAAARCGLRARLAYARSVAFYDTTLFWQWMRLPGDVRVRARRVLMAWDFLIKPRPLLPRSIGRWIPGAHPIESPADQGAE